MLKAVKRDPARVPVAGPPTEAVVNMSPEDKEGF